MTLDDLMKWEKEAGCVAIHQSNIMREEEGAIVFQFLNQNEIAKENKLYAFQMDSIEG